MQDYIGHPSQLSGVEEVALLKGKGKGMTLLQVRNGQGLDFTLVADRCMDISRLFFKGVNIGYFSPSGYVSPAYYDPRGDGFLKSFTAGFLTTSGLTAVGSPCTDAGEDLPLHGTISHTPAEQYSITETDTQIIIRATIRDASIFKHQLLLERTCCCSKAENTLQIHDKIQNIGTKTEPYMLLYHFNLGYPLLDADTQVVIPHHSVTGRNAHAAEDLANCLRMEPPQPDYEERCYYYDVAAVQGMATVGAFNRLLQKGLCIAYDKAPLPCFTQWKMMGVHEYVLGLEPGNCTPDGRDVLRKTKQLQFLAPGAYSEHTVTLKFTEHEEDMPCLQP